MARFLRVLLKLAIIGGVLAVVVKVLQNRSHPSPVVDRNAYNSWEPLQETTPVAPPADKAESADPATNGAKAQGAAFDKAETAATARADAREEAQAAKQAASDMADEAKADAAAAKKAAKKAPAKKAAEKKAPAKKAAAKKAPAKKASPPSTDGD